MCIKDFGQDGEYEREEEDGSWKEEYKRASSLLYWIPTLLDDEKTFSFVEDNRMVDRTGTGGWCPKV